MKCDNWIDPTRVSKCGQLLKSAFLGTFESSPAILKANNPCAEPCGGNINVTVDLYNEPCYGGTLATLDVNYQCEKCKEYLFGRVLPSEPDEIAEILTAHIKGMKQRRTRGDER